LNVTTEEDSSIVQITANGYFATLLIDGAYFFLPLQHAENILFRHGTIAVDPNAGTFIITILNGIQVRIFVGGGGGGRGRCLLPYVY
jgi:hypothetical protein